MFIQIKYVSNIIVCNRPFYNSVLSFLAYEWKFW